ncbi:DUF6284 family protein [Streptomyces ipomoeae]|uniref:DUF6284 family protein n=1 Tax=Streptomyces ipomoeae TaxID=103232 RepID=UPI001147936C|nr:DUF6284 family protein [Streptomyces ipomoeae]TQE20010.1 hypothetical protein Sipo7851_43075 [Streptomyces ipomoeae]
MWAIGAVREAVTRDGFDGPSAVELDEIELFEMPLIEAEMDLLDAEITALDRTPTEMDHQRLRRARRKVLTARRTLANQGGAASPAVA